MTGLQNALSGVKVLDASRVLAGPYAAQVLADLGAEVIKVEDPASGDETRGWGPPFDASGMSAYFSSANRGKKSVALNLKTPAGRDVFLALVRRADVLLENFRPSSSKKLGVTTKELHQLNPQLISCKISGYGASGARAEDPGYDFVVQGLSGLMAMTGPKTGEPAKVGVAIVDVVTGLYSAISALSALHARHSSGHGYAIDVALLDCAVASMVNVAQAFLATGAAPARQGNAHLQIVPYELFKTRDDWMILAVGNDTQWQRFGAAAECEGLSSDRRFMTNTQRVAMRDVLVPEVAKIIASRPTAEWLDRFSRAGVPAGPVWDLARLFSSEIARERRLKLTVTRPDGTPVDLVASPLVKDLSQSLCPPKLGEHTEDVLRGVLGYDDAKLAVLRRGGAW